MGQATALWRQVQGVCHGAQRRGPGAQGTCRMALQPRQGRRGTGACPPTASCTPRLSPHHGAHAPLGLGGPGQSPWHHLTPCVSSPPPPSPAYCCNALDGRWYSYDDSRVEGVQEAEVSTRSAYILFYQRRNAVPAWSASSSIRGEHPHLPARLHPDSTRAPQSHRPGHTRHGRAHVQARGVRYTHVQQSQTRVRSACAHTAWGVRTEHSCICTHACGHACTPVHGQYGRHIGTLHS